MNELLHTACRCSSWHADRPCTTWLQQNTCAMPVRAYAAEERTPSTTSSSPSSPPRRTSPCLLTPPHRRHSRNISYPCSRLTPPGAFCYYSSANARHFRTTTPLLVSKPRVFGVLHVNRTERLLRRQLPCSSQALILLPSHPRRP
jgi:hypothetical protein